MREQYISKADLLSALGPAPTIEATAEFLREDRAKVYKKLYSGQLERLGGLGVIKISIASLLRYLNGESVHVKNPPHNKTGRPKKPRPVAESVEVAR
jgi:hypothetical protein